MINNETNDFESGLKRIQVYYSSSTIDRKFHDSEMSLSDERNRYLNNKRIRTIVCNTVIALSLCSIFGFFIAILCNIITVHKDAYLRKQSAVNKIEQSYPYADLPENDLIFSIGHKIKPIAKKYGLRSESNKDYYGTNLAMYNNDDTYGYPVNTISMYGPSPYYLLGMNDETNLSEFKDILGKLSNAGWSISSPVNSSENQYTYYCHFDNLYLVVTFDKTQNGILYIDFSNIIVSEAPSLTVNADETPAALGSNETKYNINDSDVHDLYFYMGQNIDSILEKFPDVQKKFTSTDEKGYSSETLAFYTNADEDIVAINLYGECEYSILGINYEMNENSLAQIFDTLEQNGWEAASPDYGFDGEGSAYYFKKSNLELNVFVDNNGYAQSITLRNTNIN